MLEEAPLLPPRDVTCVSNGNDMIINEEIVVDAGFCCTVCNVTSYSIESYQLHVISEEHIVSTTKMFNYCNVSLLKDSKRFFCEVCDISCSGSKSFALHLDGAKHKRKVKLNEFNQTKSVVIKDVSELPIPIVREGTKELPSMVSNGITNCKYPLIGMENIVEIQLCVGEPAYFFCCECQIKIENFLFLIPHLVGVKHRLKMMKKKDPRLANDLRSKNKKRSELTKHAENYAKTLEQKEGRGAFIVLTEAEYFLFKKTDKPDKNSDETEVLKSLSHFEENDEKPPKRFCQDINESDDLKSMDGRHADVMEMLADLKKYKIVAHNDDDAKLIGSLNKLLIEALTNYENDSQKFA